MKPFLRLAIAAAVVLLTNITLRAVTPEECNNGCSSDQAQAAAACSSSCQSQCQGSGMRIKVNFYIPFGCWPDPTQQYCIVDGECYCECEYI